MTTEELLSKLTQHFPAEDVFELSGTPVIKQGLLRYYIRDNGENYKVGAYLPTWLRVIMFAVIFAIAFLVTENRWLQLATFFVLYLGLRFIIILIAGNKKDVFSKLEQILDKPVKFAKI